MFLEMVLVHKEETEGEKKEKNNNTFFNLKTLVYKFCTKFTSRIFWKSLKFRKLKLSIIYIYTAVIQVINKEDH